MIAASLLLLAATLGHAQDTLDYSFDPELFKPQSDVYGYGVTHGATVLRHLQVGVGLWGSYSEDSLLLIAPDGRRYYLGEEPPPGEHRDGVIDKRSTAHLQVGLGIGPFFDLSLDLPVVLWQVGFEPQKAWDASISRDLVSSGFGDLRIVPKFELVDLDRSPVGVALLTEVTVPISDGRSFLGEGDLTVMPMAVLELADQSVRTHEHIVRAAVNVGYKLRTREASYLDLQIGHELVYRGALAISPGQYVEIGAEVYGGMHGPLLANKPLEVSPFIKLWPADYVQIHAAAGFGVVPGVGSPDLRLVLGGTLSPSFNPRDLDRDRDGIPNNVDACPNVPEDFDGFEDEDGCPDYDNDGDGILDVDDQCPNEREDFDGFEDEDGCPDLDNDGDGIPDVADRCPNDPETFNGYQDDDGCPDTLPVGDRDGDGYRDDVDRCPDEPEDFDGYQDEDGCPDPDNDGDGILDIHDACPDDPETFNDYLDEDGCPDTLPGPSRVRVERTHIVITDKIFFEFDSDVIKPVSYSLLDEIAAVLLDNPSLARIQVEGHTDAVGDDLYNLGLSQRRAESVVRYLVDHGVEAPRLEAKGFGEQVPIDDNSTDAGRAENRRVEFLILERL